MERQVNEYKESLRPKDMVRGSVTTPIDSGRLNKQFDDVYLTEVKAGSKTKPKLVKTSKKKKPARRKKA
jgi:hypothetical protein